MDASAPRPKWYHFTKGQIIALLFFVLLLPFAGFLGFLLWMVVHPNDTLLGVGVYEVPANEAYIELYVEYDRNSEMDPDTYSANAVVGIQQILRDAGMDQTRIERPYSTSLKVRGFTSEDDFAELNATRSRILARYPTANITTHYRYTLTPKDKADAMVIAIKNAQEQADTLAEAQGRKVLYVRSSVCNASIIDSTQNYNPTSCGSTPNEDQVSDTSPRKKIVATVNSTIVFSF